MINARRTAAPLAAAAGGLALLATLAGCNVKGSLGQIDLGSVVRTAQAVGKTFEDITPEQEYYIGRAVAATVLARYHPYDSPAATRYVNEVGQALALASDRPETFGGYHFLILDSNEINAFAAPGGLILISRGMLRCCPDEDALAAVLAHEVAHVAGRHGLQAIRKGRLTSALTVLAAEGAKTFGGEDVARLTEAFGDSIGDITETLMNNGYSRAFEREADLAAAEILRRVGYDPTAIRRVLAEMDKRLVPGGVDFAKTHPDPEDRLEDVDRELADLPILPPPPPARARRFAAALAGV